MVCARACKMTRESVLVDVCNSKRADGKGLSQLLRNWRRHGFGIVSIGVGGCGRRRGLG